MQVHVGEQEMGFLCWVLVMSFFFSLSPLLFNFTLVNRHFAS